MIDNSEELLTQFFPKESYNFDAVQVGIDPEPLTATLRVAGTMLEQLESDYADLQGQLSVQTATDAYLDAHGILYGVVRKAGEDDDPYRARILAALTRQVATLAAIAAAIVDYINENFPTAGGASTFTTAALTAVGANYTVPVSDATPANGTLVNVTDEPIQDPVGGSTHSLYGEIMSGGGSPGPGTLTIAPISSVNPLGIDVGAAVLYGADIITSAVYDFQAAPEMTNHDVAAGSIHAADPFYYIISISYAVSGAFFLDFSYLDDPTSAFLMRDGTWYDDTPIMGPAFAGAVAAVQAAGRVPIYKNIGSVLG